MIASSSLIIYENSVLNPEESMVLWQRNIENFATGLAAADGKVFTLDISGNVNSYDTQGGNSLWNGTIGAYWASGLTVSGGRVYGGSELATVGCLDEATGQFQWSFIGQMGSDLYFKRAPDSIIIKDGRVFAIADGVSAHNATNGQLLWQTPSLFGVFGNITDLNTWWVGGYPLGGGPFEGNSAYVLGGNGSSPYIFKLNTDNDNILWRDNITVFTGLPSVLATYQGQVIIQNGKEILSLNETSGDSLWSIDVGASIYQPTTYKGVLLFGASDGNFYGLDLFSGTISCKTKVDSQNLFSIVNDTNAPTVFPIQVDPKNQRIYWSFGGAQQKQYTGTVCSLDLATCKVIWTKAIQDSDSSFDNHAGLVYNKDTVFLKENNALWIFGASTGNLARNQHFDHYVLPPVVLDNEVFVASDLQLTAYG